MTAKATYQFAGKTILITGGAGDIGKATAHRFAANGAGIALLDLNQPKEDGRCGRGTKRVQRSSWHVSL